MSKHRLPARARTTRIPSKCVLSDTLPAAMTDIAPRFDVNFSLLFPWRFLVSELGDSHRSGVPAPADGEPTQRSKRIRPMHLRANQQVSHLSSATELLLAEELHESMPRFASKIRRPKITRAEYRHGQAPMASANFPSSELQIFISVEIFPAEMAGG
jgi:hypothetical protein